MPKLLALIAALTLFSFCQARADDTPAAPPAPAQQQAPPTDQTPAPAPPVAKKPEEDNEPGAFMRRLQAGAAILTGNHASLQDIADKDKQIAALQAKVTALEAEVTSLKAAVAKKEGIILEALNFARGMTDGTAPKDQAAPNQAAQDMADAIQRGIAAEVRKVGVPAATLTEPPAAPAASTEVRGDAPARCFAGHWAGKGWAVPGLS